MDEAWRRLKLGDKVRVVRMPSGIDAPNSGFDLELSDVYRSLIDSGRILAVDGIDEWGRPWVSWEEGCYEDESWRSQSLAIDDDSWEKVISAPSGTDSQNIV